MNLASVAIVQSTVGVGEIQFVGLTAYICSFLMHFDPLPDFPEIMTKWTGLLHLVRQSTKWANNGQTCMAHYQSSPPLPAWTVTLWRMHAFYNEIDVLVICEHCYLIYLIYIRFIYRDLHSGITAHQGAYL